MLYETRQRALEYRVGINYERSEKYILQKGYAKGHHSPLWGVINKTVGINYII
jgi:hypothetical protein